MRHPYHAPSWLNRPHQLRCRPRSRSQCNEDEGWSREHPTSVHVPDRRMEAVSLQFIHPRIPSLLVLLTHLFSRTSFVSVTDGLRSDTGSSDACYTYPRVPPLIGSACGKTTYDLYTDAPVIVSPDECTGTSPIGFSVSNMGADMSGDIVDRS